MFRSSIWLAAAMVVGSLSPADAHFPWLVVDQSGSEPRVQVYFSEGLEPDDPKLLSRLAKAELWAVGAGRGGPKALTLSKTDDALFANLADHDSATSVIMKHRYGVVKKGGEPFLLNYTAKLQLSPLSGGWQAVTDAERQPLEIVPVRQGSSTMLRVLWQGKPLVGSEVLVKGPGLGEPLEGTTNDAGEWTCELPASGWYAVRVKHIEPKSGSLDNDVYSSVRHYATLTLPWRQGLAPLMTHHFPPLPKGTTSFGGAVLNDAVYVYGGNYGSAHHYAADDQSGDLWRLSLTATAPQWELIHTGPKRQGLAMVASGNQLIRVGGFQAMNSADQDSDLRSQADVSMFNPATGEWTAGPALPSPRSSHDAAVVGSKLYVVGGWNMQGDGSGAEWSHEMAVLDLAADTKVWTTVAVPFVRRAIAVAAWQERLYVIGGMQEDGGPTALVQVYNPVDGTWSAGPALLGTPMEGFGCSAFAAGDSLYVTTYSGAVQRLSAGQPDWEYVAQLEHPRFFHRLLPTSKGQLMVVGGSNMTTGKTEAVELLNVPSPAAEVTSTIP
jgi:N-acetylneuraminic acid mutarotase